MLYGKMESFDYTFYLIQSIHEPGKYTYVGSSRDMRNRKHRHKKNCIDESCKDYNSKLYQMMRQNGGWDAFEFIELEYHHYTEHQAHEYEQQLIDQIQPTMNSHKAWTGLSKIEYNKQYNIDNAEKKNNIALIMLNILNNKKNNIALIMMNILNNKKNNITLIMLKKLNKDQNNGTLIMLNMLNKEQNNIALIMLKKLIKNTRVNAVVHIPQFINQLTKKQKNI
jgi:hypothetical protein